MADEQFEFIWGPTIYVEGSCGDSWDPAWGADDVLYTASNDTGGFFGRAPRNVSFAAVSGSDPTCLSGKTVNDMDDFGEMGEKKEDGRTWKSNGCISVGGVLYHALGRHCYGNESGDADKRQTVSCATIIKSFDGGKTWTPSEADCYASPMFGPNFATPYFIHYGKDDDTSAAPPEDEADKYIYAVSNDGFWDNGDFYILGRVKKEKLSNLNSGDWEFLTEMLGEPLWGKDPAMAMKIIDNPRHCGETGVTYVPALKKYVLIAWHYLENGRDKPSDGAFDIYLADHPWGPWEHAGEKHNEPQGWYCPRVMAKFQEEISGRRKGLCLHRGRLFNRLWHKRPRLL